MKYRSTGIVLVVVCAAIVISGCATTQTKGDTSKSKVKLEYACPVCDTDYVSKHDWAEHVKKHHPKAKGAATAKVNKKSGHWNVNYNCPVCDTGFLTEEDWKEHASHHRAKNERIAKPKLRVKKVDTGKTSFACPVCDTGFISEHDWKEHELKHHKRRR